MTLRLVDPAACVLLCSQCSDLSIPLDSSEQQRVGVKGIITMAKPIQFKSSVKEVSQVTRGPTRSSVGFTQREALCWLDEPGER